VSKKLWFILLGAKAALIAGLAIDCQATDIIVDRKSTPGITHIVKQERISLPAEHASVRFAPNDSTLSAEAAAILDIQAEILRGLPRAPVWIYGYADPEEAPLPVEAGKLARQRAEAVRDYLLAQGAELKAHRIFAAVAERKTNPSLMSKIERPARYATTFMLPWAE
jgi:outer membrane protein OmpA-like peptidoglycan-associated protein